MSDSVTCDYCKKSQSGDMVAWFHVSYRNGGYYTYEGPSGSWDFCSPLCLSHWAEKRLADAPPEKAKA